MGYSNFKWFDLQWIVWLNDKFHIKIVQVVFETRFEYLNFVTTFSKILAKTKTLYSKKIRPMPQLIWKGNQLGWNHVHCKVNGMVTGEAWILWYTEIDIRRSSPSLFQTLPSQFPLWSFSSSRSFLTFCSQSDSIVHSLAIFFQTLFPSSWNDCFIEFDTFWIVAMAQSSKIIGP